MVVVADHYEERSILKYGERSITLRYSFHFVYLATAASCFARVGPGLP